MKVLKRADTVSLVVTDVDKTLYGGDSGNRYVVDGTQGELALLAHHLKVDVSEVPEILLRKRQELAVDSVISSISHAVYALGVSFEDWSRKRCACYFPEDHLKADPKLVTSIQDTSIRIVAVTNSPREVGRRVLITLGLSEQLRSGKIQIFGPEDFGVSKPDPLIYIKIGDQLDVPLAECVSIGDHEYKDCQIPLEAEYGGAILVTGPDDFADALESLKE